MTFDGMLAALTSFRYTDPDGLEWLVRVDADGNVVDETASNAMVQDHAVQGPPEAERLPETQRSPTNG